MDAGAVDNFTESLGNANAAMAEYMERERYASFAKAKGAEGNTRKAYENAYNVLHGSAGDTDTVAYLEML